MPTGYTAKLVDGEQSFEDFILMCARNFGACIMQREDNLEEKPKIVKEKYYNNKLVEKLDELDTLSHQSDEDCLKIRLEELEVSKKHYEEYVVRANSAKERLEGMLEKDLREC